mmetsp:Transcript_32468/g.67851  ORF Transcript_32468/g.67851 Transcript_32468/m.67851 type:complete len:171 (-) Transcript_32468:214-726(-)
MFRQHLAPTPSPPATGSAAKAAKSGANGAAPTTATWRSGAPAARSDACAAASTAKACNQGLLRGGAASLARHELRSVAGANNHRGWLRQGLPSRRRRCGIITTLATEGATRTALQPFTYAVLVEIVPATQAAQARSAGPHAPMRHLIVQMPTINSAIEVLQADGTGGHCL